MNESGTLFFGKFTHSNRLRMWSRSEGNIPHSVMNTVARGDADDYRNLVGLEKNFINKT